MPARDPQEKPKATATPLASIAPQIARPTRNEAANDVPAHGEAIADTTTVETLPVVPLSDAGTVTDDAHDAAVSAAEAGDAARAEARRLAAMPYDAAADAAARAAKERTPKRRAARRENAPTRTAAPVVVPRTIAEMQRQAAGEPPTSTTAVTVSDEPAPAAPVEEEPAPELQVPFRFVALVTAAVWLLTVIAPEIGFAVSRLAFNASITEIFAAYSAVLLVGGIIAVVLLNTAWRRAFGTSPQELSWRTLPALWRRRYSTKTYPSGLPRRDPWVMTAIAALFGFLFLIALLGYAAASVPEFRVQFLLRQVSVLVSRALCGAAFLGLLYQGLAARQPRTRAAFIAGVALGVAVAVPNVMRLATLSVPVGGESLVVLSDALVASGVGLVLAIVVGVSLAWLRLQSRSVWAAVAFHLTLVLLQFPI